MQTRVTWYDGWGNSHESIPLARFWHDGAEHVVVTALGRTGEDVPRILRVVHVDRTYRGGKGEMLVGEDLPD